MCSESHQSAHRGLGQMRSQPLRHMFESASQCASFEGTLAPFGRHDFVATPQRSNLSSPLQIPSHRWEYAWICDAGLFASVYLAAIAGNLYFLGRGGGVFETHAGHLSAGGERERCKMRAVAWGSAATRRCMLRNKGLEVTREANERSDTRSRA